MTKKDFFRVLIKIFGLFSLIETVFYAIPTILSYAAMPDDYGMGYDVLGILAIGFIMLIGFFLILIFNADAIIKALRLDRGFDDDVIQFERFNSYNVVKLALIIIAGLMIVNNLPILIEQIAFFVRDNNLNVQNSTPLSYIITPIAKIILAYFLLREQQLIFKLLKLDEEFEYVYEDEELLDEEETA